MCVAMESRLMTRWEIHKYARAAYNMGIRYIGGCCGFEPYHIRAIAEEVMLWLTAELSRAEGPLAELHTHKTMPVNFHGHG